MLFSLETVSLDVVAGVVGSALFLVGLVPGGRAVLPVFAGLAAGVLVVYNLDHLLDARDTDPRSTPRRLRYSGHRRLLAGYTIVAAFAGAVSLMFLPSIAWKAGSVVALYQVLYFVGLKLGLRGPAKRLMAAAGWAAGLAIPAWCVSSPSSRGEVAFAASLLAIVGLINLQSYALVEAEAEADHGLLPGSVLRGATIAAAVIGLGWAILLYPEHASRWLALAGVGCVQVFLTALPGELVHPAGEWSLALLGLFALAG
ncbi:MAG TPA: hypothetical protein VN931_11880 [Fibrobacteria bacterium]|nr:hypothetical protein [Fibrobacteria bacterium]